MCVCVCVCVCARARARACVRECVWSRTRAGVHVCVCAHARQTGHHIALPKSRTTSIIYNRLLKTFPLLVSNKMSPLRLHDRPAETQITGQTDRPMVSGDSNWISYQAVQADFHLLF